LHPAGTLLLEIRAEDEEFKEFDPRQMMLSLSMYVARFA
jgi:hypothetical protein